MSLIHCVSLVLLKATEVTKRLHYKEKALFAWFLQAWFFWSNDSDGATMSPFLQGDAVFMHTVTHSHKTHKQHFGFACRLVNTFGLCGQQVSVSRVGRREEVGEAEGSATLPSPSPSRPSPTLFFFFFSARKLKRCQSQAAGFLLKLCDSRRVTAPADSTARTPALLRIRKRRGVG